MTRFLALVGLLFTQALVVNAEPPPRGEFSPGDRPPPRGNPGEKASYMGGPEKPHMGGSKGERGDWRGGMSGFGGRPPMRSDAFDKLPEAEKKQVRAALDKVWSRPEVMEAKDKAMRANEEMRDVIRQSLTKIDPEAAAILAKIEPKDHFDPRSLPKLPPVDSAEFPKVLVTRLGMEMQSFSRPERRNETRQHHERIIQFPNVAEAVSRVETTSGEERVQAVQKLREVYRETAGKMFQAARERRAAESATPQPPPSAAKP